MFSRIVPLCIVFLLFAAFTPAQDAKKELESLQGEWIADSVEKDGKKTQLPDKEPSLTIKRNQWLVKVGKIESNMTLKIDPTKNPKTIDLTYPTGSAKGIYKLEDGVITMCRAAEGVARPTAFKSDGGAIIIVYKREEVRWELLTTSSPGAQGQLTTETKSSPWDNYRVATIAMARP